MLKRVLHWFGGTLGFIGVVFVTIKLRSHSAQFELQDIPNGTWGALVLLAFVYATANTLLARAWYLILKSMAVRPSWRWALQAYGVSQLAKYIPGNIFQLASRQAIGQAAGFTGKSIAKSALYELLLITTAGVLFAALTVPLLVFNWPTSVGIVAFLVIFTIVVQLVHYWFGSLAGHAICLEALFFVTSASIFVVTLYLISPGVMNAENVPALLGAYVVAWLTGFLTPGAPAGIGVRELVLTLLLAPIVAEADLLLAVVLGRVITMFGDLVFFALTGILKVKKVD